MTPPPPAEKNVIDENTGTPIFEIEEETGVIKTAVCCLDREKTPDYSIQVRICTYLQSDRGENSAVFGSSSL